MFARVNDIFINKHPYVYKTLTWLSRRVDMKETKRKYLFLTWYKSGLHELICELLSKWLSYFLLLRSNMIISSQKAFISYRNFDILQAQQCKTWKNNASQLLLNEFFSNFKTKHNWISLPFCVYLKLNKWLFEYYVWHL